MSKVPEVALIFWILKILATTLGETAGDAVSMSLGFGYFVSSLIFGFLFIVAVFVQIRAERFHPIVYWATIVATTTLGTTIADYADRSLGIGYAGGASLLLCLLLGSMFIWYRTLGTLSVSFISHPKAEMFYWMTIMFSQTLGTALGDWIADDAGLGYAGGIYLFVALLITIAGAYYFTNFSRVVLFWLAFVLTRPLGAVVGDFLDKPLESGGLEFSRFGATAVLAALMIVLIVVRRQTSSENRHEG